MEIIKSKKQIDEIINKLEKGYILQYICNTMYGIGNTEIYKKEDEFYNYSCGQGWKDQEPSNMTKEVTLNYIWDDRKFINEAIRQNKEIFFQNESQ